MTADLSLRSVGPKDQILLLSLFESAREKELALVAWNADRRRSFIETQFRAQQQHYQTHFPHRDHHVVMLNGKPVGMTDIARNVEEAATGTKDVSTNIVSVSEAASETGGAATQVLASASDLSTKAQDLRSMVQNYLSGIKAA